jgi:hypothetical protein
MNMMRVIVLSVVASVVVAWPGPAGATVMLKLDLPQMVGGSDVIFVGKAIKTHSRWTKDRRHIVTDTTFKVEQGIRGVAPGKAVVVRRLGGTVDGVGMRVSGTPQFKKNDQVLLFTEKRGGHRYVVGMKQGVFRIHRESSGRLMVRTHLAGLELAKRTSSGLTFLGHDTPKPRALSEFISDIRKTISLCAKEQSRCQIK